GSPGSPGSPRANRLELMSTTCCEPKVPQNRAVPEAKDAAPEGPQRTETWKRDAETNPETDPRNRPQKRIPETNPGGGRVMDDDRTRPRGLLNPSSRDLIETERRRGRGARSNRVGRFEIEQREAFDDGWESLGELDAFKTDVYRETAKSIIAHNDSPDI